MKQLIINTTLGIILGVLSLLGLLIVGEYVSILFGRASFQQNTAGVIIDILLMVVTGLGIWAMIRILLDMKKFHKRAIMIGIICIVVWLINFAGIAKIFGK